MTGFPATPLDMDGSDETSQPFSIAGWRIILHIASFYPPKRLLPLKVALIKFHVNFDTQLSVDIFSGC